jgi:hypothetical protein
MVGTASGLYAHDGGTLYDVTPADLTQGRVDSLFGLGWGTGPYGAEAYGTARSESGIVLEAATWSFDNFGQVVLACSTADGRVFEWDPSVGGEAAPVTGAPLDNAAVFVTDERHVVCVGADGDPRLIKWSSREDRNDWVPSATNSAGDLTVSTPGKLIRGVPFRGENLVFGEYSVHLMRYVGAPYFYGVEKLGDANGLVGPNAVCSIGDQVAWMGESSFWTYDGSVRPIPCEVQDYVFGDFNVLQGAKVCAGHNNDFGEIWWFYPSADSVENDRYVIWSYREGWWSFGQLARTTWVDRGIWPRCVAASPNGILYQHEDGWTDSGKTRVGKIYAKTGALQVGNGDTFAEVQQLIPDGCENLAACTRVFFGLKETPMSATYRTEGPIYFNAASGYADTRFTARQVEMKLEAVTDGPFTFGELRAEVVPGSSR